MTVSIRWLMPSISFFSWVNRLLSVPRCAITYSDHLSPTRPRISRAWVATFPPHSFGSGANASSGGKIDAADYGGAAQYVDWYLPMTYDFFGAFDADGPTAPHSPLTSYPGIPQEGFNSDAAIQKLKAKGVPASKLLLGIGSCG